MGASSTTLPLVTKRWLPIAVLGVLLVTAWATGLYQHLTIESIRGFVIGAGWLGPLVFLAGFALEGVALCPAFPFLLSAALVWPPWEAFALNLTGSLLSCVVGFTYARSIGRDAVAERLPERMRRFEARVVERELETVVLVRLVFFISPLAHWALGLSPVSKRAYLTGSLIGMLPWVAGFTFFGGALMEWGSRQGPEFWLAVLGGVALLLGAAFLRRRRNGAARSDPA